MYQKILQLSYLDKLMEQVQLAFRDRYKNKLTNSSALMPSAYSDFSIVFNVRERGEGRVGRVSVCVLMFSFF